MKCPECGTHLTLTKAGESKSVEDLGQLLASIDMDGLDSKSTKFVEDTKERYEKWGARTTMSDKQISWLKSIAEGGGRF